MKISVFGLGYVGCVSLACLAKRGHEVVGVDVVRSKVKSIANGKPTIVEPEVDRILEQCHREGRVTALSDATYAVHNSDVSLICVGTPSCKDGSLDLTHLRAVSRQIGKALKTKPGTHLVVLRSTVMPGTVESIVVKDVRDVGGRRLQEVGVVIVPEFLREGTAVQDYLDPPLLVVGSADGKPDGHQEAVAELLGVHPTQLQWMKYREAEILKMVCNSFHALKVAFGNEVGALCSALSIDGCAVMERLCADRKLNISPAYLRPGLPYGGSCLPKDLSAVVSLANRGGVSVPLLQSINLSNAHHKERMLERLQLNGHRRVGLDGLAFKLGTDDLRESPLVQLAEYLIGKGFDLRIFDPAVDAGRLIGANRKVMEEHLPHLAERLVSSASDLVRHAEVLVVTRRRKELQDLARSIGKKVEWIDLAG